MEDNKFDFKFLNKVMYIVTIILVFFALKEFGILDKIMDLLAALTPFFIGVVICWISKPLANKLRKFGISKGIAATIALVIIFAIIILALAYIIPVMVTEISQFIKDVPNLYSSAVNKINMFLYDRFSLDYKVSPNLGD